MSLDVNHSILFSQTQRYEKKNQSWKTAAETLHSESTVNWWKLPDLRAAVYAYVFFLTYQHSDHIHSTCIWSR